MHKNGIQPAAKTPTRALFGKSLLAVLFSLAFFFSGCKKEKEEPSGIGSCKGVPVLGRLSYSSTSGTYTYRTSGGGTITFNLGSLVRITHDAYPGFFIELWGDVPVGSEVKTSANHENLKGKHLKDRRGNRRTIILPDGAKITMVASAEQGPLVSVSIYDGAESHHINAACATLEHSAVSQTRAQELDNAEADGETATIEMLDTGWLYVNIYTEDAPGNKIMKWEPLGETFFDSPSQVRDHYDDPRLGHT